MPVGLASWCFAAADPASASSAARTFAEIALLDEVLPEALHGASSNPEHTEPRTIHEQTLHHTLRIYPGRSS